MRLENSEIFPSKVCCGGGGNCRSWRKNFFSYFESEKEKFFFRLLNLPKDSNFFLALGEKKNKRKRQKKSQRSLLIFFPCISKINNFLCGKSALLPEIGCAKIQGGFGSSQSSSFPLRICKRHGAAVAGLVLFPNHHRLLRNLGAEVNKTFA